MTVGYGDYTPKTDWGKVVIMLALVFTFFIIPYETTALVDILSRSSVHARRRYVSRRRQHHVIVCGGFTTQQAVAFVMEFFHDDHGFDDLDVVLMHPQPPCPTLLSFIRTSRHVRRICFIEGSPLRPADLTRAAARDAHAFFMLADPSCQDPREEDAYNITIALSVRQFIHSSASPTRCRLFVQLVGSGSRAQLEALMPELGGGKDGGEEQEMVVGMQEQGREGGVVCVQQLRLNLIAQACICPGFSTLLINLCRSSNNALAPLTKKQEACVAPWQREYAEGCAHEIYKTPLSTHFQGWTFPQVAEAVYKHCGAVLFALQLRDPTSNFGGAVAGQPGCRKGRIIINPCDYVVEDVTVAVGFVIAQVRRGTVCCGYG
eukprot:jgi/Chlat1/1433/Chrsp12S01991